LLYPILVTPLVADDFLNPFSQYPSTGGGYWKSVVFGWDAAFNGASMRLSGNVVGAWLNNFWLDLAGRSLVNLSTFYAIQKYLVFVLCGFSLSYFSGSFLLALGHKTSFLKRTFLCSFVLFSTIQIHGLWSNDPVSSYPMTGFMVAAIGFFILGFTAYTSMKLATPRLLFLFGLCIWSVFYYETLVSVGLLTFPILLSSIPLSSFRQAIKRISLTSIPAVATFLAITLSQLHTAARSQTYGGTTVNIGWRAFKTFVFGLASSFPASAWNVTSELSGIGLDLKLVPVLVLLCAALIALWHFPRISNSTKISKRKNWRLLTSLVLAPLIFWIFAVGLQSLTEKVQNETGKLGYVYSYYAVGAATFTLFASVSFILMAQKYMKVVSLVLSCFLVFASIQASITWSVSDHMSRALVPNRTLLAAFSNFEMQPMRCQALRNWAAGGWPAYYEDGMIQGLQEASIGFHKEPFCRNFLNP
jgi:hypothetical protein